MSLTNFTFNYVEIQGIQSTLIILDHYLVDKHSTGGVGDKVTVVLGPILSAVGMATTKLSGKGLGHTGGTIDKFEAIRNFKFSTTKEELVEVASKTGVGLMGYSDNIVPLDKKSMHYVM